MTYSFDVALTISEMSKPHPNFQDTEFQPMHPITEGSLGLNPPHTSETRAWLLIVV